MAKVLVEYDTVTKAMACVMDGKGMDNVVAVNMGQDWDEADKFNCSIYQVMKDEANDSYTRIITTAEDIVKTKKVESAAASVETKPDVIAEIGKYFAN